MWQFILIKMRFFIWTQLGFNENKWHTFALTVVFMSAATQLLLPDTAPLRADLRDTQLTIKWFTLSLHANVLCEAHFFVNTARHKA